MRVIFVPLRSIFRSKAKLVSSLLVEGLLLVGYYSTIQRL